MKFRNLFFATLAASAMVSCSNNDDPIQGAPEAGKAATLSLNVGFVSSVATRATTDAGTAKESNVNNIHVMVVYSPTDIVEQTFTPSDITTLEDGSKKVFLTQPVKAGVANVKVFVNGGEMKAASAATIDATGAFDLGNYASNEGNGNFLMSGVSSNSITIQANEVNEASVQVNRVAAKLDLVGKTEFDLLEADQQTNKYDKKVTLKLTHYSYANLMKKSNVMSGVLEATGADDFFNPWVASSGTPLVLKKWADVFGQNTKAINVNGNQVAEGNVDYCFENANAERNTQVFYTADVYVDDAKLTTNFYIYEGVLYTTFAELDEAKNNMFSNGNKMSDDTSISDFAKIGVRKYEDGKCYYAANVLTNGNKTIARNNWYKLSVNSIADLGRPTTDTPEVEDPTLLNVTVQIMPWTVNANNFDL